MKFIKINYYFNLKYLKKNIEKIFHAINAQMFEIDRSHLDAFYYRNRDNIKDR